MNFKFIIINDQFGLDGVFDTYLQARRSLAFKKIKGKVPFEVRLKTKHTWEMKQIPLIEKSNNPMFKSCRIATFEYIGTNHELTINIIKFD